MSFIPTMFSMTLFHAVSSVLCGFERLCEKKSVFFLSIRIDNVYSNRH
jgi:hypothetical protein